MSMLDPKRILIITKFRFIGDTLLAVPIFRAARRRWPGAHITLLTGGKAGVLLQNNPYLDAVFEFDPIREDKGLGPFLQLVRVLGKSKFDLCLVLNRSFHSALIPWLAKVNIRAGFTSEGRGPLLNRRIAYDRDKSEIACYFDVLRAVAPDCDTDPSLELWVSDQEKKQATLLLEKAIEAPAGDRILVGIQPGASLVGKRWLPEYFARLANTLTAMDPRVWIVVLGGDEERDAEEAMLSRCNRGTQRRIASFVGACDLRGTLGIVAYLQLFVGNDTAVTHSAVALDVATVALFGPTNPRKWGNFGERHRVIQSPNGTMEAIALEDVVAMAADLLAPAGLVRV
jgi:heptosyltransferase-2